MNGIEMFFAFAVVTWPIGIAAALRLWLMVCALDHLLGDRLGRELPELRRVRRPRRAKDGEGQILLFPQEVPPAQGTESTTAV